MRKVTTDIPDPRNWNPSIDYLRELVDQLGLSQRATAALVGLNERTFRNFLSGKHECPYAVQYCLEVLCTAKEQGS